MRIGIISDTHNQLERTRLAVRLLRDVRAEALVHCGDITGPEIISICAELPCYFVFGNHDADMVPHLQQAIAAAGGVCLGWGGIVTLAGKRVAVTHGHMTSDVRRLIAETPDYLLFGHYHISVDVRDGPTRRINPGAIDEADPPTVALLDLASDNLEQIAAFGH